MTLSQTLALQPRLRLVDQAQVLQDGQRGRLQVERVQVHPRHAVLQQRAAHARAQVNAVRLCTRRALGAGPRRLRDGPARRAGQLCAMPTTRAPWCNRTAPRRAPAELSAAAPGRGGARAAPRSCEAQASIRTQTRPNCLLLASTERGGAP